MVFKKLSFYIIISILFFIFFYSRFITENFDHANPWTSYLYQYGFGVLVFVLGMYIIIKNKALKFGRWYDSVWFSVLIGGFVFYALFHAIWILVSIYLPYYGS